VLPILPLHLQLLVVIIDEFAMDAFHQLVVVMGRGLSHGAKEKIAMPCSRKPRPFPRGMI
jgi:hypothetical protein